MKRFKKILATVMCIVIMLTAAPLSGFVGLELNLDWLDFGTKASAATYSGKCGAYLTWSLDTSTGELIISGPGAMYDYSPPFDAPWYDYSSAIKNITIGDSVTSISDYAFHYCSNLTSITIGNSVTSIGYYAFGDCTSLTSIAIPDSVTSIDSNAFNDCSSLTSITIPDSVTSISSYTFYNCTNITSVTIPDSVTSIGSYAFNDCSSLTSITIPDSVTSIGKYAFEGCTGLTNVTIGDSVTSIGYYAFYNTGYYNDDSNWENNILYIGDYLIEAKHTISENYIIKNGTRLVADSAFENCTSLKSIAIPDSVTSIGDSAFEGCTGLTSVTIPDSVTSIGSYAFEGCTGLTNLTIRDSVISIGYSAFKGCTGLTSVTIPDSVTGIGGSAFEGCTGLTSITIPDSVTSIGDSAFEGCTGLTNVKIGDSVTSIGDYAFYGCSGITELTMPISAKIYNSPATFYRCTNIEKITLTAGTGVGQNYGTSTSGSPRETYYEYTPWYMSGRSEIVIEDGVKTIGYCTFYNLTNLKSITIPNSVTSIRDSAFEGCTGLTNVTIGDSVTGIGYSAFEGCTGLTSITIPDSVTSIGNSAFEGCTGLTIVTIGDSVTSIGYSAFYGCSGINKLTMPISAKIYNSQKTFYDCTNIEQITLTAGTGKGQCYSSSTGYSDTYYEYTPWYISGCSEIVIEDSVTSIGSHTFYNCTNITSVTIGDSVTSIGDSAFSGCTGLTSVTIGDSITSIGEEAFYYTGYYKDDSNWENGVLYIGDYLIEAKDTISGDYTIKNGTKHISVYAFKGCTGLTSVTIPDSVTSIGYYVFSTSLADIYYCGSEVQWYKIYIIGGTGYLLNTTIHFNYCNHSYSKVETAPTCTERGYTTYTCKCGDSYVDNYVDATGHSHTSKVTTPATHTATGVMTYTCHCGDTYTETIDKIADHNYNAVVTAPTCEDKGYTTYTCECGDSYVADYVDAKGHTAGEWVVTKPATSTQSGTKTQSCTVCGSVLNTQTIPAYGKVNSVDVSNISLDYKSSTTINPQISADAGVKYTVSYSSSNPSVASVDANGKITTKDTGSATITVTVTDEFGNTVSDTCNVEVKYNWWQWIIVIVLFGWIWY